MKNIPVVRDPSALMAECISEGIRLEWNPSTETDVIGYNIYRDTVQIVSKLSDVVYIDSTAAMNDFYRYFVTAVNVDGEESPESNIIEIKYTIAPLPEIIKGEVILRVPNTKPDIITNAYTITFDGGQSLVFDADRMRMRTWCAADGTHLMSPDTYGNALDITEMDNWGMPMSLPATENYPASPKPYTLSYDYITQPNTHDSGTFKLIDIKAVSGGVCIYYTMPLRMKNTVNFTRAEIWETWTQKEKTIGSSDYIGFNRRVEMKLPSTYDEGFSVCLNDAFGINGSGKGGITYETHWGNPYLETVRWAENEPPRVIRKNIERSTGRYHPDSCTIQSHPFKIVSYPKGTLIFTALRCYHSVYSYLSNYARFGKYGLYPNFMVDCATSGKRFTVDTFEYLYHSNDDNIEAPQSYIDATFHYRKRLAHQYKLADKLNGLTQGWDWRYGECNADDAVKAGMDMIGHAHHFWFSAPYAVDTEILHNVNHPVNKQLADYVKPFTDKGIDVSFWARPEFVKTSPANAFSDGFITYYYGYNGQTVPPVMDKIAAEGLPMIKSHPEWIRYGKDGKLATLDDSTAYQWIPMKLSSGWYDEIMQPTIERMSDLGFKAVFQDGGSAAMVGVEYTSDGKALPVMPYYWRWFQDIERLGMELNGELPIGWANSVLPTPDERDAIDPWAIAFQIMRGNLERSAFKCFTPRFRHIVHSLYAGAYMNVETSDEHVAVARFAQNFIKTNGHPENIKLDNLRWDFIDPTGQSPLRGWVWDSVTWLYADGRSVRYPTYAEFLGTDIGALLNDGIIDSEYGHATPLPAGE